ncbi:hypothetical protein ACFSGI_16635 [Paenibacillus nicotianae]|uniref:Toxin ETX/toxin MTX2 n=1 Tax=Paenibacillus nicotianae TaxID=1526551 RepID=A0ABW4UX54_9BACL
MKRLSLATFILGAVMVFPSFVGATGVNNGEVSQNQSNVADTVKAFTVSNGEINYISTEEYNRITAQSIIETATANMLTKGNSDDIPVYPSIVSLSTSYKYNQLSYKSKVARSDLNRRISVAIRNEGTVSATRSISYSSTQTYTSSISFTAGAQKNAVSAGITGGKSWEGSYAGNETITQTIPAGKYAWMDYYPYMNYSYGTFKTDVYSVTDTGATSLVSSSSQNVNIYSAIKSASSPLPDGVYSLKESTSAPTY